MVEGGQQRRKSWWAAFERPMRCEDASPGPPLGMGIEFVLDPNDRRRVVEGDLDLLTTPLTSVAFGALIGGRPPSLHDEDR